MNEPGFLYILINPSLVGLVKIGKTSRDPESRARELSQATGVATPFFVAYSLPFADADLAERYLHTVLELHGFRLTANREFFQMPLQKAIELMLETQSRFSSAAEYALAESHDTAPDDRSDDTDATPHPALDIYEQAMAYWHGHEDTIQDMDEALRLLDQARRLDFPAAYSSLAEYYSQWSQPENIGRALEYLKEGAMRGHGRCYFEMARLFLKTGHLENFTKSWKKYFTSQTFLRNDDQKWTLDLSHGVGLSRIGYTEVYLHCLVRENIPLSPDIQQILIPFKDELIADIEKEIEFWMTENAPQDAANSAALLEYVQRVL